MQKFTIFTLILSIIVVTVIAELVVQDYLHKIYSIDSSMQQATLVTNDYVVPHQTSEEVEEKKSIQELTERLEKLAAENTTPEPEISTPTTTPAPTSVQPKPTVTIKPFTRIESLLPALQIRSLNLEKHPYNQKLFQLIDTQALNIPASAYALLNTGTDMLGTVYQFDFNTPKDAENAFDEIRILANSFQNIHTNQTNQFGNRSFYINHLVKVGEVFVVIYQDKSVYAFSYKKDYHETFKTFFGVLF